MHGFPFWFGLLLHPLTWALLVALVVAIVICVVHFGWRRALFRLLLILASLLFLWHPDTRSQWAKWWRMGGL